MTVWTLAGSGQHGQLQLGMTSDAVEANFGAAHAKQHFVWKYDAVELHFAEDRLWLIHCEFGSPPQPPALASAALRLHSEGFQWPITEAAVVEMAEAAGFEPEIIHLAWGDEVRFGLARVQVHERDEIASWSVRQVT